MSANNDDGSDIEEILGAIEALRVSSPNLPNATNAIAVLANASRHNISARQQLADPKLLHTLIEVIDCSLDDSTEMVEVALRCIGNACIDNDTAREHITEFGFTWAIRCLGSYADNTGLIAGLTIKVLYNICTDFDLSRQKCFHDNVHHALIDYSTSPAARAADDVLMANLFVELLFWICSQKPSESGTTLSQGTLKALLDLPALYESMIPNEEWAMLLGTCLTFLRDAQVQKQAVEQELVGKLWDALITNEDKIDSLDYTRLEPSESEKKLLVPLSTSMIWCLSDIAALPEFAAPRTLEASQLGQVLLFIIIEGSAHTRVLIAACQMLGNVLWSLQMRAVADHLVESKHLHRPVLKTLVDSPNQELLHSAAGLLVQLVRPSSDAREIIGRDETTRDAVERLCKHETPQLRQDGIILLRALGKDCPANRERFADLAEAAMQNISATDQNMIEASS